MLAVESITKAHGGTHGRTVLRSVSLTVRAGEYVAVMGESGVGKSTLLNLIAGLDKPDSGRVVVAGEDMCTLDDEAATLLRRRSMGFVFQAFHVLPYLTVAQNVALPLLLNGASRRDAHSRAVAMLAELGMETRHDSLPRELSGGETQRVAIARALVHAPRLILADEPTGNLDPDTAQQVLRLLRERVKAGAAAGTAGLIVTHSALAAATADRILLLTAEGLAPFHAPQATQPSQPAQSTLPTHPTRSEA
ncbi:ABC transporter ATP-binding protein [Caballeronia glathei]|uniref:ABC transporter ATP-binding protein n=1 Tax=Caballeronia glathei TaxID=60547 RepID=A0A069Q1T0_9BURK|nr:MULTISPECIES: ABC transporter ATP-binding protein [Burkholderiaceae]KDR43681.1 ABC transporter ATP-binding protein [Caballeronia glathei]